MVSYYIPSTKKIEQLNSLLVYLQTQLKDAILSTRLTNNELEILVKKEEIQKVVSFLKSDSICLFKQLIDITAVDYPEQAERFCLVYNLLSMQHNLRIRVITFTKEYDPVLSMTPIFANADWLEREVWDMFGVYFAGHNDLRRLLTDFGFDGHPLRKDFPLTGFVEISYDDIEGKVYYKPVELMQEYRDFDYKNPWMEGIEAETFTKVKRNLDD